jgi:hypothetical protein
MAELAADEEALVSIEGIDMMTEFLACIKKQQVESDYVPNIDRMLKKASDPITVDEIRTRMTKISGKILEGFSASHLAITHVDMFMDFYKKAITDKNIEVKVNAVYNLPCFYFTYRNLNEETK